LKIKIPISNSAHLKIIDLTALWYKGIDDLMNDEVDSIILRERLRRLRLMLN
jgi:hypothetical protein